MASSRYVPAMLDVLQQAMAGGPDPAEDPGALGTIEAPVLVLQGADTRPFFSTRGQYAIEHIPNSRLYEIPGIGPAAPLIHFEALVGVLTAFVSTAQQPA